MKLDIEGVEKRYGDARALSDVTLRFTDGVVGLLGPNGAGKSTLLRIVTALTEPTDGTVRWNGTDIVETPRAIREAVGYLPQKFGVYPNLTAEEFLSYLAGIRGVRNPDDRIEDLLDLVNLSSDRNRRLGTFSGGMRQRVGIAQALLSDPSLLVVDEPTVGLDPEERIRFRNILAELGEERIVVLSTHIVPDVEATASDIAVLDGGRVVAHEPPSDLIDRSHGSVWERVVSDAALDDVRAAHTVCRTTRCRDGVLVRIVSDDRPADADPVEPTLEDAYLHLLDGRPRQ